MQLPEHGRLHWLARLSGDRVECVGFIRSDRSGAFVVGGSPGFYCTRYHYTMRGEPTFWSALSCHRSHL